MSVASNAQVNPKTILVVDDDLAVLSVIKCMLENSDYMVMLAHSGQAALRLAERHDLVIDLILTDVVMPDMTGPDVAEAILAIRPNLRVLFMSGYTDSEVVRVKVLDRALDFLPKPFTSDGLVEMVGTVLGAPMQCEVAGSRR